jgi:hypothetical protein
MAAIACRRRGRDCRSQYHCRQHRQRLSSGFFDTNIEGVKVTNNFFYLSSGTQGLAQDGSTPTNACSILFGKALADCKFTPRGPIT